MALVPLKSLQSIMHILGKIPYGRKDGKAKGVKSLYFEMRSLSSFRTQLNETPSLIHRRLWTLLLFCIKPGKNEWKRISGNICYKENIVPGAGLYHNLLQHQKNTGVTDDSMYIYCFHFIRHLGLVSFLFQKDNSAS